MARRKKVTKEEIVASINTMRMTGRRPTIKGIQGIIGGSTEIISQVFRELGLNAKTKASSNERDAAPQNIPPETKVSVAETARDAARPLPFTDQSTIDSIQASIQLLHEKIDKLIGKNINLPERRNDNQDEVTNDNNPQTKHRAQRLRNLGKSVDEIAKAVGQSPRWVERNTKGPRKIRTTDDAEIAEAKRMKKIGCSYSHISRTLNRSWGWARLHAGD